MSGARSRNKGAVGERELAALLTAEGFSAHRGRQYHGGPGTPDVRCADLPGVHWEVKRTEKLSLYQAMAQAKADAADGQMPVVAHRRNHSEWLIVLRAEDFFRLVRESELPLTAPRTGAGAEE